MWLNVCRFVPIVNCFDHTLLHFTLKCIDNENGDKNDTYVIVLLCLPLCALMLSCMFTNLRILECVWKHWTAFVWRNFFGDSTITIFTSLTFVLCSQEVVCCGLRLFTLLYVHILRLCMYPHLQVYAIQFWFVCPLKYHFCGTWVSSFMFWVNTGVDPFKFCIGLRFSVFVEASMFWLRFR